MVLHKLKTWLEYFQRLVDGIQSFEYRRTIEISKLETCFYYMNDQSKLQVILGERSLLELMIIALDVIQEHQSSSLIEEVNRMGQAEMTDEQLRKEIADNLSYWYQVTKNEHGQDTEERWLIRADQILSLFAAGIQEAVRKERERIKILVLKSIADELEYPSDMPDELWQELNENRDNVVKAMRSTVRLTKNGITDRFLQALSEPNPMEVKDG